jgi:hypothetical protein
MYKFPGDYNLKKIDLSTFDERHTLDIRNLVLEAHIFESIYSPTITCELLIADSSGLVEGVPIFGQERISIKIETPKSSSSETTGTDLDNFDKEFIIYKISKRGFDSNQGANIYILHLCTLDFLRGIGITFSSTYDGKPEEIVKKLWKDAFPNRETKLTAETSLKNTRIIFPNTNLFRSINITTNYATNDTYKSSSYLFYEDHINGYNYVTLESLMNKKPKEKENYFYENKVNVRDSVISPRKNFSIRKLEMIKDLDTSIPLSKGMFNATTISHDLVTKKYKTMKYNYDKDFDSKGAIYSNPLIKNNSSVFNYSDDDFASSTTYLIPSDNLRKNNEWVISKDSIDDQNFFHLNNDSISGRSSKLQQADYMKMKMTIPGDLRLTSGKVINVYVPTLSKSTNNKETLDRRLSGKYLITNVKHTFAKNDYSTSCEIVKDSFETELKFNDGVDYAI